MTEKDVKNIVKNEIENALQSILKRGQTNALLGKSSFFSQDGKNVYGNFGSRVFHSAIRPLLTKQGIVSGVINYSSSYISIDTESSAATDDLDTISPLTLAQEGDLIIIQAFNDARTVVVKNGTGNIVCNGDFSLDGINDRMLLQWNKSQLKWVEIARNDDIPYSALTLTGSIVNADINASAAIDISKTTLGTYTAYTAYSPTIAADGSMTISSTSFVNSRYTQIGKTVIYNCSFTCTTGGIASARIRVPMPITPRDTATNSFGGSCRVTDSGTNMPGMFRWSVGGYIEVFKQDGSNWTLSASTAVQAVFIYEVS